MKFWTACFRLYLATLLLWGGFGPDRLAWAQQGKAYMTQGTSGPEYDTHFGESWQSVRTFRLLQPLAAPLKVYVQTRPVPAALYRPEFQQYVEDGLKSWQQALQGRLVYQYTSRKAEADITVSWAPTFPEKTIAGLTTYRVGHADIEIKTVGIPASDVQGNILHELGHALGISGHSQYPEDMMVGVRKWRRDETAFKHLLSPRDIQAIRRLYSSDWQKGEDLYAKTAQTAPKAASQTATLPPEKPEPVPSQGALVTEK